MNNDLHFSSAKSDWETPDDFFHYWDEVFNFELDACASEENSKVGNYYDKEEDALSKNWNMLSCGTMNVWMNPPYSRGKNGIIAWVKKAYEESLKGCLVVGLLPAKTDTVWWQDWVANKATIKYIRGRIKFVGIDPKTGEAVKAPAPFPSAIAIWWPAGMAMI